MLPAPRDRRGRVNANFTRLQRQAARRQEAAAAVVGLGFGKGFYDSCWDAVIYHALGLGFGNLQLGLGCGNSHLGLGLDSLQLQLACRHLHFEFGSGSLHIGLRLGGAWQSTL